MSQKKYDLNSITNIYNNVVDYMIEYLLNAGVKNEEVRSFDVNMHQRFDRFLELAGAEFEE